LIGCSSGPVDYSECECAPACDESDADGYQDGRGSDQAACGECWPVHPDACRDCDCDGYESGVDCDDDDDDVYPGARESIPEANWCYDSDPEVEIGYPDGKDNDCDGQIDEDVLEPPRMELDCDGRDDDCDGEVDEGVTNTYFQDDDNDGYGSSDFTAEACAPPTGWVDRGGDCNDSDPVVYPGATEVDDGIDNDCDGDVDEME
jgi:hypothetical protein